jgi:hypothetical protein
MPIISKKEAIKRNLPLKGLHTILMPKTLTNPIREQSKAQSIDWLKSHGYKYGKIRTTTHYYRFNQIPAIYGAKYYTHKLPNGVELVFLNAT